ncbi:MAG: hypothetical protein UX62_C0051G0002 [Microgenomates group bacterium GW2011_GWA2_46_7]|nr:MAG: hypothetical protein UX62_C0051G0002 [Microgenomates group bacterium GW2011_GWA2_46_7]KKU46054.1 MAG: hypothetical protein UX64_C0014G0016 [Microgenomates group bacterium GW2011_GWC2_46_7]
MKRWRFLEVVIVGLLIVVSLGIMRDLLIPGLPALHDANPHIARAISYHTALLDGQFPPMWAKEVLGGIGSPVMMLNYQLPYMLGEIWHRMGLSYFDSYKFTLGLSYVLSGVLMYLALRKRVGRGGAWVGSLLYTLAPYHLVDIYVRGALGESLAFVFPPLLILGFTRSSLPLLTIGWAGLFLTHPLASAAFSAFFLGYCLWVGDKNKRAKRLKLFGVSFGLGLLISAFNLVPTLAMTQYTYYSPELSNTLQMFPTLSQLIHSRWGYGVSLPGTADGMSFELGLVQWGVLLMGAWVARREKESELRYLLGMSLVVLVLILPISIPVYQVLKLSAIIDFPWRLLMCLVFASAWIGAKVVDQLKGWGRGIVIGGVTVALLAIAMPLAHTDKYWNKGEEFFARETGDSYGEYAPCTRATRESAPFGKRAEFTQGSGTIEVLSNKSNQQIFKIISEGKGVVRINTTFFPGWEIPDQCFVTKRTLSHIDDSGLISCPVEQGESTWEIKFRAPTPQRLGNMVTLGGIGIYLWILFRSFCPLSTKKKR